MYQDPYGQNRPNQGVPRPPYPNGPRQTAPPRRPMQPQQVRKQNSGGQPRFFVFLAAIAMVTLAAYLWITGTFAGGSGKMATVLQGGVGNQYHGQAVIVRDETLVSADSVTDIDFVADEGVFVPKNATLCSVYSAGYNQLDIDNLRKIRDEVQAYQRDKLSRNASNTDLEPIQNAIKDLAVGVRTVVQRDVMGSLTNMEKQLKEQLQERKTFLSKAFVDDNTLISSYESERAQLRKIESWTTTYAAQEDCLISFYTDGYESTVNAQTYQGMSASQTHDVLAGKNLQTDIKEKGKQPIYRAIMPDHWYVLMLCEDRTWNPSEGQVYKMRLTGFDDYLFDATVQSATRLGGEILVRMNVQSDVRPVLNIRTSRITVGEFVNGFSVPAAAVIQDKTSGEWGVVVTDASGDKFIPVEIVSQNGQTYYVRERYAGSMLHEGMQVSTAYGH